MERVEYGTDGYPYKLSMSTGIENTEQYPTVEAIPKADYENRLNADMVAILDKIRAEIERGKTGLDIEFNGGIDYALSIIDKYKAEVEPQESEEKE